MRVKHLLEWGIVSVFLLTSLQVQALGPRSVLSDGTPVQWLSMPVTIDVESDQTVDNGAESRDISALIDEAFAAWDDLTESDVTLAQEDLGAAVDNGNICTYLYDASACPTGPTDDGVNPLVIDEDGTITLRFFGLGNMFTTLGFASIISADTSTGGAAKGEAVFNAACLSGVERAGCAAAIEGGLSFSDDDLVSFIVHELGHFLGLDHSQVNLEEATDADDSNNSLITTMFPTFIVGNGSDFKTPEVDDRAGLAQLYPSSSFTSGTWTINGTIYDSDGTTEIQCANVVARNVANPRVDAVSALSGDFAPAGSDAGDYEIVGLTAGSSYTLDVEPIGDGFMGSSGYTPCRGSNGESAPPSFTSFSSSTSYSGAAGETVTVDCTIGSGCVIGDGSSDGDSGGGCSLVR